MTNEPDWRRANRHGPLGDWAAPLGDRARSTAVVVLATRALRRRLGGDPGAASIEVAVDRLDGRLTVATLGVRVGLAELASRLAPVPTDRWPGLVAAHVDRMLDAVVTTSTLRLHRWADVEPRLLLRAVPLRRAGRLAERLGAGIALDLVIDLGDGHRPPWSTGNLLVAPTAHQLEAWAQPGRRILRCAAANTRRRSRVAVVVDIPGGLRVTVLFGDETTSGALVDVGYALRRAASQRLSAGARAAAGSALASALTGQVVVVVETPGGPASSMGRHGVAWLYHNRAPLLRALATDGRAGRFSACDPLPPNVLAVDLGRPPPHRR